MGKNNLTAGYDLNNAPLDSTLVTTDGDISASLLNQPVTGKRSNVWCRTFGILGGYSIQILVYTSNSDAKPYTYIRKRKQLGGTWSYDVWHIIDMASV